ncbi:MAG: hypothetical protein ACJ0BW_01385 [Pontiellaceae bacterium]
MKINNREMWLISSTIMVLLSFIVVLYINKKLPIYKNNAKKIKSISSLVNSANRNINMNKEWIDNLEKLQKDLKVFSKSKNSVTPELMQIIKNIALKNGVIITKNQPFKEVPTGDLFEIGINCSWQTNLESIINFLDEIQQNGMKYDVVSLNISPDGNNPRKLKGNMVIQCAYIRK